MRALILEDNHDRRVAMMDRLADRFSFLKVVFFDSAEVMIEAISADGLEGVVIIALDHDLDLLPGPDGAWIDPGTGVDVARCLSQKFRPICRVVVHTTNSHGAHAMTELLQEAGWPVIRIVPHDNLEWIDDDWFPAMRNAIVESTPVSLPTVAISHNVGLSREC